MDLYNKCLDIFYNEIVLEATKGRIYSYFTYNIIFNTKVKNEYYEATSKYEDLLIPTLDIKNKEEFDRLLVEYVKICLDFYDNINYLEEITNDSFSESENKNYKEKTIMVLLFANATIEDFKDPIRFLRKRINFINNTTSMNKKCGYLSVFDSDIEISIEKDVINNETPYQFIIKSKKEDEIFTFPKIKFGISEHKLYIYSI